MQYNYNRNIKDVVLVTDDKERLKSRTTNFILNLLRNNGLNPITTTNYTILIGCKIWNATKYDKGG